MPITLPTLLNNIDRYVSNSYNAAIIKEFYNYMNDSSLSESYLKNNLKTTISFAKSVGDLCFNEITSKRQVQIFLDSKKRPIEEDPDCKWITTWNDYLSRLKYFFRWLHNYRNQQNAENSDWNTPDFVRIKKKLTKRDSPYLDTEIWDREEIQKLITYEPNKRNKAIIALAWDMDGRPHEITLMRIKHIKLLERYGEAQVPHEAKTGSGPVLLTISFPYIRDWLNEHPFRNSPEARLICNLVNGSPIRPDTIWTVMKLLRERIVRMLETNQITQPEEREYLRNLVNNRKWNPYCIRHSAITFDSDILPGHALNKKVRWSMNSRQPSRYIKKRWSKNLKRTILAENGIEADDDSLRIKKSYNDCPRCTFANVFENKYCAKCSYPLSTAAYDEIKKEELAKIEELESRSKEKIDAIWKEIEELKAGKQIEHKRQITYRKSLGSERAESQTLLMQAIENVK